MTASGDLLPTGFRDRLPPQAEAGERLARGVLDILSSHGYARVAPPLAETEAAFAGRSDGAQRIDRLRFTDPVSQRTLALRPDMTVQIGRIATTRLADMPRPLRLSYHGSVLKLHAGQLRPEREMTQIGAELIGSDSVSAAREIVAIAVEALQAIGAKGITVDFTLPDLVDTLAQKSFPLAPDRIDAVKAELDMKDAGGLAAHGASAYLPLLEATGPFDSALDTLARIDAGGALASRIDALRAIAQPLGDDIRLTLDPTERHGFEYQSWFGFSLFAEGYVGSIGRGGTYAIPRPDGGSEPAAGFSLYTDPLVDAGVGQVDALYLFLPIGHDRAIAAQLRSEGWCTLAALDPDDDGAALGCSHLLDGETARPF